MGLKRTLLIGFVSVTGLCAATGLTLYFVASKQVGAMQQMPDPFVSLAPSERPPAEPALTVLMAGIDSGLDSSGTGTAGHSQRYGRSDALMLVRLSADRKQAYVISIPRDSWVPIPGRGNDKINAGLAVGGPGLMVRTVEQLTGIHIDHVALIDMAGFKGLIDAVGGVTIDERRMNGTEALTYVRERHSLPRGDLDRAQRHQQVMRALFQEMGSEATLSSPRRALALFGAISKTTTVDHGLGVTTMTKLLMDFKKVHGNVRFVTAPVKGVGWVGNASVIFLDPVLGPVFWEAVGRDDLEGYLASHRADVLGE